MTQPTRRPGGRSARVREAVLAALVDELEASGYGQLTFEGLAARAGVHKTTLYRRWGTREGLLLDAALGLADEAVPVPDTGGLEGDLRALAEAVADNLGSRRAQALLRAVIAEALADPALAAAVRSFWHARFAAARAIGQRAIDRGEARRDLDADHLIELLVGPLHLRALVTHEPIDADFVASHAALVAAAVAPSGRDAGG